jgi:hypothetical protein
MTQELLDEITRDGVPVVAQRLGVNHTTLRWQLAKLKDGVPVKTGPGSPGANTVQAADVAPVENPLVENETAESPPARPTPEPTQRPISVRMRGW